MSLKNVENALDLANEKLQDARRLNERLEESAIADVIALTLASVDELHNAITDMVATATDLPKRKAWVITDAAETRFMTFEPDQGMFTWTDDIDKALQLSRRADSELLARELEDAWKIKEMEFDE